MIKNYLKIAWRNLLKYKIFSLINIFGLAIGIAVCTIIFLYVQHELSYDQYHKKADRIVRVSAALHSPENNVTIATAPTLLAPALKRRFPEVEDAVRIENMPSTIEWNNNLYREENFSEADQSIFNVFDFNFIEGSPVNALAEPNSIVIDQTIAKKYFGKSSALGKILVCNKKPLMVKGVFSDRPANSDLKIKAVMSADFDKETFWLGDLAPYTFVLFKGLPDLKTFSKKLQSLSANTVQLDLNAAGAATYRMVFDAELLKDVHFSKGKLDDSPKGDRQYNLIFSLLAVFILLIALLNYINLTTARSFERAREVGIRKVVGARPLQLIRQFLFESFLLIIASWIIGNILVSLGLPLVNRLLETSLVVDWKQIILFTTSLLVITFVLAGFYPALIMSSYQPVTVLKGRWQRSLRGVWLRKAITVTQFAITAALIMGTTVIYKQMYLLHHKNLGYNEEQLMSVRLPFDSTLQSPLKAFQHDLKNQPQVLGLTSGSSLNLYGLAASSTIVENDGRKKELLCNYFSVDPQFVPVHQMQVIEGRNFSEKRLTDKTESFIVNEAFVRSMGWKSAIGKKIEGFDRKGQIIGVVRDFSYKSLHNIIEPLVLVYGSSPYANSTTVRINPRDLPVIEATFKKHFPDLYFDYSFFDDMLNAYYKKDQVTMSLFNQFTVLAIFISCLGLYGLVTLVTVQRTKEIGVRKVLGATLAQLFSLLTKDFLLLIIIALAVAIPAMTIAMGKWLSSYAYHINLDWTVFAIPIVVTLLIALAVVSKEIIRAASMNPVKSLKTE